jgi:hypothetical protein
VLASLSCRRNEGDAIPIANSLGCRWKTARGYLVGHFRHLTYQDGSEEAVITLHNNKTVVLDDEHAF